MSTIIYPFLGIMVDYKVIYSVILLHLCAIDVLYLHLSNISAQPCVSNGKFFIVIGHENVAMYLW